MRVDITAQLTAFLKHFVYLSIWYYHIYQSKCIIPVNCFIFPLYFILGQLWVHASMPGCPVCIVKPLLLIQRLSDKLNDDDEDDTGTSRGLCIQLWDSFDACGVSSCGIWAPLG